MKFKKKPVVIQAARISSLLRGASTDWNTLPDWVIKGYDACDLVFLQDCILVHTLEGKMRGNPEDMLIQGVKGELYACKPDIFNDTYEAVDDSEPLTYQG